MMQPLTDLLLAMSNALLVPDILLLLLLATATVVLFGGLVAEWLERRRFSPAFQQALRELQVQPAQADARRAEFPEA